MSLMMLKRNTTRKNIMNDSMKLFTTEQNFIRKWNVIELRRQIAMMVLVIH